MASTIFFSFFSSKTEPSPQLSFAESAAHFKKKLYENFKGFDLDLGALSEEEKAILQEVQSYPHFFDEMQKDNELKELFFKCCLRDKLPLKMLILYPDLCRKIQEVTLSRRLSLVFEGIIQVSEEGNKVTIPIATTLNGIPKRYNLLTPFENIRFGDKVYTINQIFQHFLNKKLGKEPSEFDVINGAIRPWRGYFGVYESLGQKIDTTQEGWWELLEPFKKLTMEETVAFVKEGIKLEDEKEAFDLDRSKAVIRAVSTTSTPHFTVLDNHGLVEVFLPKEKGYSFYPFGKFPRHFPKKFSEVIPFFYQGDKGDIRYPDQSNLIAGKLSHYYTLVVTEQMALNVLREIGLEIQRSNSPSLEGRFHVRHHSCAQWVLTVLERGLGQKMPDFYNVNPDLVDADSLFKRVLLQSFEQTVWKMQVAYWGQIDDELPLPVALNRRHLEDPAFSSLLDLTS